MCGADGWMDDCVFAQTGGETNTLRRGVVRLHETALHTDGYGYGYEFLPRPPR